MVDYAYMHPDAHRPSNEVVFTGMQDDRKRMDLIISHNVAGANQVAFKSVYTNSILLDPNGNNLLRDESIGVTLQTPGQPLNMALTEPNAFFLIEGKNGPERTRDGRFTLSDEGKIVNTQGQELVVLDQPTDIKTKDLIHLRHFIKVDEHGEISVKGKFLGRIAIDYQNRMPGQYASVLQGHLEQSNVNLEDCITKIVQLKRHHETLQNMMAMNQSVAKSLTETYGRNV